jgi:hypothetical protein
MVPLYAAFRLNRYAIPYINLYGWHVLGGCVYNVCPGRVCYIRITGKKTDHRSSTASFNEHKQSENPNVISSERQAHNM